MTEKPIMFMPEMVDAIMDGRKTQTRRFSDRYDVGDLLWVKERYDPNIFYAYRPWKSPIFMPKRQARIWLRVTGKKQERLLDITDADAKAEGVDGKGAFCILWCQLYDSKQGKRLKDNPLVWVYEFERTTS